MTTSATQPAQETATTARFDVHAHYLLPNTPPAPVEAMRSQYFLGSPMPSWSPEGALAFMDRVGIATQMLSLPMPVGVGAARAANSYAAELVKAHPTRFGLLACLPLTDVEAGLAEIVFAFDELHADGVILLTNYQGTYLGDAMFEPVFAELNRRRAVAFVHPTSPPGFDCVACGRPGPVIEFPFDTCRSVTDMLYAGVLERFPDITFILSHAGGALPALAPRLSSIGTLDWVPHPQALDAARVREQLARLYFDTAIAGFEANLAPVLALTSADHIVFGTDYPPASEGVVELNLAALDELTLLSEAERAAVRGGGRQLFTRFQQEIQ